VTVQGQLTYRITDPQAMAAILNFSIDPATRAYRSSDPEKLAARIVNEVQSQARGELLKRPLDDALRQSAEIAPGRSPPSAWPSAGRISSCACDSTAPESPTCWGVAQEPRTSSGVRRPSPVHGAQVVARRLIAGWRANANHANANRANANRADANRADANHSG
jgi:hypothetical protein